ncbi:related to DNA polymerase epsilon catalytic subunit A [Hanseniaspora guilliermondii]|uniref:DNA polymerase epsilon catalytic subunit n=1 Tax=Hanseniaspora guilliermondii TaxID=56406 RepID=A0A1L0B342_9ASCO|nr:related to DNA polymerase epsilon catalytic subunit A [Hanseniaspora guilliermondii]
MSNVHFKSNQRNSGSSKVSESSRLIHQYQVTSELDSKFDFNPVPTNSTEKVGWLSNIHPILANDIDPETGEMNSLNGVSGVDLYWLDIEGGYYKTTHFFKPYLFVLLNENINSLLAENVDKVFNGCEQFLKKEISGIVDLKIMDREDLKMDNHLIGLKRKMIKISFNSELEMNQARFRLNRLIASNIANYGENGHINSTLPEDFITDIREYDVPFHTRVMIDIDLRVGKWFTYKNGTYTPYNDRQTFPDPVVLAFDIETAKAPLKFPDAEYDPIMMISYMIDGEGFLITNREIISKDIDDFEYTPKPELKGDFTIFNEEDEKSMILRFFEHIQDVKPTIIATYNGDFFDWPYLDKRATINEISMYEEIGFRLDKQSDTYNSSYCCHMDCFAWVNRDSYLPQGSRGLKAVTRLKLGYDPLELDPELMTPYAYEQPQKLSEYSVSDAVATYYLYMKYVHPFIFSLCTIIPLNPDETLRKGTGTLCEMLLMVEAYKGNIVFPNKYKAPVEKFYDGHLLLNETYSGGKVLAVESGVFRSDLKYDFNIDPATVQQFIHDIPDIINFFVTQECSADFEQVTNLNEVKEQITAKLNDLIQNPKRFEKPLIYHIDVASMYPNIMITNRLQPDSMKTEHDCAKCDFNSIDKTCDRRLEWKWRGDYLPAGQEDYGMIRKQLQQETFSIPNPDRYAKLKKIPGTWDDLSHERQVEEIKKRLTEYSVKSYKKNRIVKETVRESIVCQRENPFYASTVREFRDRRYHFKGLAKKEFQNFKKIPAEQKELRDETLKKHVLNDSLQLAHKVILNSFYGYVMRKGSRWYSMEMGGITCYTGSKIITMANGVITKIGRPLELDTDGIWCILPSSFPEDYKIKLDNGKTLTMPFIGSLMNERVYKNFTNNQYHTPDNRVTSENSILFEVDGPYKAMILPSSQKEGEGIKKRYAVFDENDKLVELKGFELKRRGELQLVKNFQNDLFKQFLKGDTLEDCYKEVAKVADRWLDIVFNKGSNLEDEDLIELICENKSMAKPLMEYGDLKSTSITTAKRLGEFLGEETVKDKGLQVKYIIANKPAGSKTTERAIPVAIFSHEDPVIKERFLKRWLKDNNLQSLDPRDIIDWEYYKERLSATIQKIITIPAALQKVDNPVPRVDHPDWLNRQIAARKYKQTTVTDFFNTFKKNDDIEDISTRNSALSDRKRKISDTDIEQNVLTSSKDVENELFDLKKCPNPMTNYSEFLKFNKKMWIFQEKQRQAKKTLFGKKMHLKQKALPFRSKQAKITSGLADNLNQWIVLGYKPDPKDRNVTIATICAGDKLNNIRIKTPKHFYFLSDNKNLTRESLNDDNLLKLKLCEKIYPDGHDNEYLYEVETTHEYFDQLIDQSRSFVHKYRLLEDKLNTVDRLIMVLGGAIRCKNLKIMNNGLRHGFSIEDLDSVDSVSQQLSSNSRGITEVGYPLPNLDIVNINFSKTTLGYSTLSVMFQIIDEFGELKNSLKIFALKPSEGSNALNSSVFKNKFANDEQLEFEISEQTHSSKHLFNSVNKYLAEVLADFTSNAIFMVNDESLLNKLKPIHGKYPVIKTSRVNKLVKVSLQNYSNKLANIVYKSNQTYINQYKALCDVSFLNKLPITELNDDVKIMDYILGQRLLAQNYVLDWDNDRKREHEYISHSSKLKNDEILYPGIYSQVTVKITIKNQLLNAILTSNMLLNDIDLSTQGDINHKVLQQLSLFRQMVKDIYNSEHNYTLLNLLEPWLYSIRSSLTTDSLLKIINQVLIKSKNVLKKQIAKNCRLVYFSSEKEKSSDIECMISIENRFDIKNSITFTNYILTNLSAENPLLSFILPVPLRIYDLLIFKNMDHYMGHYIKDKDGVPIQSQALKNFKGITDEKMEYAIDFKWVSKALLPEIYTKEFESWALIILDCLLKRKQENHNKIDGYIKMFAKELFERVERLWHRQMESILNPEISSQYEINNLPGISLKSGVSNNVNKLKSVMNDPLISMCNLLNEMITLNSEDMEARKLRKAILSIFEIKEFAVEGQPFDLAVFNIGEVICSHCFHYQEITNKTIIENKNDNEIGSISCGDCKKKFDTEVVVNLLISKAHLLIAEYNEQDLRCIKCGSIKEDLMSMHCECSGFYKLAGDETLHSKMKLLSDCGDVLNLNIKGVLESML